MPELAFLRTEDLQLLLIWGLRIWDTYNQGVSGDVTGDTPCYNLWNYEDCGHNAVKFGSYFVVDVNVRIEDEEIALRCVIIILCIRIWDGIGDKTEKYSVLHPKVRSQTHFHVKFVWPSRMTCWFLRERNRIWIHGRLLMKLPFDHPASHLTLLPSLLWYLSSISNDLRWKYPPIAAALIPSSMPWSELIWLWFGIQSKHGSFYSSNE